MATMASIRIIRDAELLRDAPKVTFSTPLGGAVRVSKGSAAYKTLIRFWAGQINTADCILPDRLETVPQGLKSEMLYARGSFAEAQSVLEHSSDAREYALALVYINVWDRGGRSGLQGPFDEFQALARSISAAAECLSVLEELCIGNTG